MAGIADMLGDLALQRDGSLEHRREGGKVVVGACLDPDRLCPGPPLCRLLHQAGRDAGERSDRVGCVVHRPLAQRLAGRASKFACVRRLWLCSMASPVAMSRAIPTSVRDLLAACLAPRSAASWCANPRRAGSRRTECR